MAEFDIFSNVFHTASDGQDMSDVTDSLFVGQGFTLAGENGFDGANYSGAGGVWVDVAGSIFGSQYGILSTAGNSTIITISVGGSVTGLIANGTGTAIKIAAGQNVITNAGSITGNIWEAGNGGTITNTGTMVGSVSFTDSGATTDSINNSGLIEGSISQSTGKFMFVTNSGTIAGASSGVAFDAASGTDKLINSAVISSSGSLGVTESGSTALNVTNSGTIQSDGQGILDSGTAAMNIDNEIGGAISGATVGVQFNSGSAADALTNGGAIHATGDAVLEHATANLGVTNTGSISSSTAAGVHFSASSGQDTLDNSGTITAHSSGVIESGAATLAVDNDAGGSIRGTTGIQFNAASTTVADSLTNAGTIHATGVAVLENGTDFMIVDNQTGGAISGLNGVEFNGAIDGLGDDDVLSNDGTIHGKQAGVVENGANNLKVENNGGISGGYDGIVFNGSAGFRDTFANTGTIFGAAYGVVETGTDNLDVKNDGSISAGIFGNTQPGIAVQFEGASGTTDTLVNNGTISGPSTGVFEQGNAQVAINNTADISGGFGIELENTFGTNIVNNSGFIGGLGPLGIGVLNAGGASMVVDNSGTMSGFIAIYFSATAGHTDTMDNTGTVRTTLIGGAAINETGAGALDITNSGHIGGGITFGAGNNVYDGTLGDVTGAVVGGAGTDAFTGGAGSDNFNGGAGNDTLIGNGGNDILTAGTGTDTIDGGSGRDTIAMGANLTAADTIDGGDGRDTVTLSGNYASGVTFADTTMVNVETLILGGGNNYKLTTADTTVAAGATLTVDGSALSSGKVLTFDGSADTDGHFNITGGAGADVITGGDLSDTLTGGGGVDKFVYLDPSESTSKQFDKLIGFDMTGDKIDLDVAVTGIDTTVASGRLTMANFDTNLAAAISAAHLTAGHAVLFDPTLGNLKGDVFLVVDANGVAGYQAGQDYVFEIVNGAHLTGMTTGTFI